MQDSIDFGVPQRQFFTKCPTLRSTSVTNFLSWEKKSTKLENLRDEIFRLRLFPAPSDNSFRSKKCSKHIFFWEFSESAMCPSLHHALFGSSVLRALSCSETCPERGTSVGGWVENPSDGGQKDLPFREPTRQCPQAMKVDKRQCTSDWQRSHTA